MASRPAVLHLAGCLVVLAAAGFLLVAVFPSLVESYFPKASRPVSLRGEGVDFLFIALVPVAVWLLPPIVRGLARLTHRAHRALLGRAGFYIRYPTRRPLRFRDTLVRALSPFAIDLLVISEIEYYVSTVDPAAPARNLLSVPLLLLAGVVTSLIPGPWLVDALDLRLVNPAKGELVREASMFDGILGPLGAVALIVSFVTLAHAEGDSYTQGLVLLGLWTARMFPAVLVAVSVYRIFVEPEVIPGLEAWSTRTGIPVVASLDGVLAAVRPASRPATDGSEPDGGSEAEARCDPRG